MVEAIPLKSWTMSTIVQEDAYQREGDVGMADAVAQRTSAVIHSASKTKAAQPSLCRILTIAALRNEQYPRQYDMRVVT